MTRTVTLHGTGFQLGDVAVTSNDVDNMWEEIPTTFVSSTELTVVADESNWTRTVWIAVRRPTEHLGMSGDPGTPGTPLIQSLITTAVMVPNSSTTDVRLPTDQTMNSNDRWTDQGGSIVGSDLVASVAGNADALYITLTTHPSGNASKWRTWSGTLAPNPGIVKPAGRLEVRAHWSFNDATRLGQTLVGAVDGSGMQTVSTFAELGLPTVSAGWATINYSPLMDANDVVGALVAGPERMFVGEFFEVQLIGYHVELIV